MNKVAGVLLVGAALLGTVSTLLVYTAVWGTPEDLFLNAVLGAFAHLFLCWTYVGMGESLIEDAVKSVIVAIVGGAALLSDLPLLGLLTISASICAFVVSRSSRRVQPRPGSAVTSTLFPTRIDPGGD